MKLTVVFLLVVLASYSYSPSAACDSLQVFADKALYSTQDDYMNYISNYLLITPPVKLAALQLKSCAEGLSADMKQAKEAVLANLIGYCGSLI